MKGDMLVQTEASRATTHEWAKPDPRILNDAELAQMRKRVQWGGPDTVLRLLDHIEATNTKSGRVTIEVRQEDWIPGFAAYIAGTVSDGPAHVVLNVGGLMAGVRVGDIAPVELPYIVAETLMHEVIHVLEEWAGVEFSEERVEVLLEGYRAAQSGEAETTEETEIPWFGRPCERCLDANLNECACDFADEDN